MRVSTAYKEVAEHSDSATKFVNITSRGRSADYAGLAMRTK